MFSENRCIVDVGQMNECDGIYFFLYWEVGPDVFQPSCNKDSAKFLLLSSVWRIEGRFFPPSVVTELRESSYSTCHT